MTLPSEHRLVLRTLKTLVPLLLAVGMMACAGRPIHLQTGPRALTPEDYADVYEAWTREAQEFEWVGLEDILHLSATFESWEFRWAYVVRYADDHALEGTARNELLRASLDDAREHHRFFVTLAGNVYAEQNLASPHSAWRVVMIGPDGRQSEPLAIERVRRPSAAERVYFPSISPHRQAFRLIFAATHEDGSPTVPPDAESVLLRFAGARGQADLRWNFTRPGTSEPGTSEPAP